MNKALAKVAILMTATEDLAENVPKRKFPLVSTLKILAEGS